ncbi:hypothetical protein GCM10011329_31190 [Stakelama pacifica]|nr:hypothetical protein [Stakelama pacifica]GGO98915.1 hypothetical protein GCM10011329_31190 [Stakelama pacifica]
MQVNRRADIGCSLAQCRQNGTAHFPALMVSDQADIDHAPWRDGAIDAQPPYRRAAVQDDPAIRIREMARDMMFEQTVLLGDQCAQWFIGEHKPGKYFPPVRSVHLCDQRCVIVPLIAKRERRGEDQSNCGYSP